MAIVRLVAVAACIVAGVTGCSVGSHRDGRAPATCGVPPKASGPDSARVFLTLVSPTVAVSGSTITPMATIKVAGPNPVAGDLGQPANVDIVRDGKVVGAYQGYETGTGVIVGPDARSGAGQSVPVAPVLLSGCPTGRVDSAHPNATRHPLPPGPYELVAMMEDSLPGVPAGLLVAAPVPITVGA